MKMTELNLGEYDIAFPGLGIDKLTVKSEAFSVFGVSIAWYGIIITLGMLLAIIFCNSKMKKYGLHPDRVFDAIMGGVIGGIVGARTYFVLANWDYYSENLKEVISVRNGGLAIYGGIIGAILVGGIIAKIKKIKILPLLDLAGIGFLIGQGIGRWGNFFNHEAFGYNTDLPWGMTSKKIQEWIIENNSSVSSSADIIEMTADKPVHPCFLYESLWCFIGLAVLLFISKRRKYDGQIFLTYVFWYGLGRFFIEGLRTDSLMLGNLRISQVLAAVSVITSFILLLVIGSKVKRMGEDYVLYVNTEESKRLVAEDEERVRESLEKTKKRKEKKKKNDTNEESNEK